MRTNDVIRQSAKNALRGFWGTMVISILATIAIQSVLSSILGTVGLNAGISGSQTWIDFILENFINFAFTFGLSIMGLLLVRDSRVKLSTIFLVFDRRLYPAFFSLNLLNVFVNYVLGLLIFLPQFVLSGFNQYLELVLSFNHGFSADRSLLNQSIAFVISLVISVILFLFLSQIISGIFQIAIYLRYDYPELTLGQSLKQAWRLLKPSLWQYIWLQISLIGWFILGLLALVIGVLWANAYAYALNAAFYEALKEDQALTVS
ncbi:hypothetical protein A5886_001903 [Enterococcus sp. 8G7_MSG3316]|uniref:Integral membrane protein n=1 Tax=Candidatus Enterococcus testudinis TaxID=1834191 RepID=A0A242A722_9ENTE|nr:DUF975 family protein [Enterococcus sp. 8G7_MSG3316]OTN76824.1 hypothetical protein A5886_001903 [Enterococcus sp. 8G7_MSG3316]